MRSAALRVLRRIAPRERGLHATAQVLKMETRRDVILSLMAAIGNGRYEPGLASVLGYLTHRDPMLRKGADKALLAWGAEVLPALRRAARKARPDLRRVYEGVIESLEGGE